MKKTNCSCNCGNIFIKGQLVPLCFHYNIDKDGFQLCKTHYLMQSKSIEIQNTKSTKKNLHRKIGIDLKCTLCETAFRVITCDSKLYLEKSSHVHLSNEKLHQYSNNYHFYKSIKNNCILVIPFTSFMNSSSVNNNKQDSQIYLPNDPLDRQVNNKLDEGDTDFELMFSNKYDPFVGSYEYHMNIPFDEEYL